MQFHSIGKVNGSGNSNPAVNDRFSHRDPAAGVACYRLKQVNYNGDINFSPVITLISVMKGEDISMYPNPCRDVIQIVRHHTIEQLSVRIWNSSGQVVYMAGMPDFGSIRMETVALPEGHYTAEIGSNSKSFFKQFIKIRESL